MSQDKLAAPVVDLRSDTFTQPTPAMREAICNAVVGDDMVGEDPTVNELEAYCCDLFDKPAAVFCCSGTQSNQAAIWAHCRPGDELLIEQFGHLANYEAGGPAALSGVSVRTIPGTGGMLDLEQLEGTCRPPQQHFPQARLLCLENTTNIGGGRAYPLEQMERVTQWGREQGLKLHLDGARIFNACVARGYSPADVAAHFDTVSVCFSKGLGCPMGSMLLGDVEMITRARRARKLFGGALRQAGIVAAAGLYALKHHRERLAEDHRLARRLAERISQLPGVTLDLQAVETNIVFFTIDPSIMSGAELVSRLGEQGVKLYNVGPQRLRIVTHLDVDEDMIDRAAGLIESTIAQHR